MAAKHVYGAPARSESSHPPGCPTCIKPQHQGRFPKRPFTLINNDRSATPPAPPPPRMTAVMGAGGLCLCNSICRRAPAGRPRHGNELPGRRGAQPPGNVENNSPPRPGKRLDAVDTTGPSPRDLGAARRGQSPASARPHQPKATCVQEHTDKTIQAHRSTKAGARAERRNTNKLPLTTPNSHKPSQC